MTGPQVRDSALIHTRLKSKKNPLNQRKRIVRKVLIKLLMNSNHLTIEIRAHRKKMTFPGSDQLDLHHFCKLNITGTDLSGNLNAVFDGISNIIQTAECNYRQVGKDLKED